jgi:catalase
VAQKIGGGPSVLYDAVALLPTEAGAADLTQHPGAKDFVSDAFAHCKFIGFSESAIPLLDAVGISPTADAGIGLLASNGDAAGFVERCRDLRFWDRELQLVG